jgi:uncharacterized protein YicC (UPF0701 family)
VDFDRARAVVAALKELKKRLRLKGEPDLGFVARHPDVLSAQVGDETPIVWAEVQPIVEAAARDVLAAREREGAALARDLSARLGALEALAASVADRAPARLAAEADRLRRPSPTSPRAGASTSSDSPWRSRCSRTAWT